MGWLDDAADGMLASEDAPPPSINVVACGELVTVDVREAWTDIGAVTTAARWQAGCGSKPFDAFETRDENGTLLAPQAKLGPWLHGRTLYVNLLPGVGA